MEHNLSNIFYVYLYLDPNKLGNYVYGQYKFGNEPFYVGRGKNGRLNISQHIYKAYRNIHLKRRLQKMVRDSVEVIVLKYKENISREESYLIETDMIKTIGRFDLKLGPLLNLTDGEKCPSGVVYNEEQRNHRSNYGSRKWRVTDPNGKVEVITNLRKFSLEHGKNPEHMRRLAECGGVMFYMTDKYFGWKVERIFDVSTLEEERIKNTYENTRRERTRAIQERKKLQEQLKPERERLKRMKRRKKYNRVVRIWLVTFPDGKTEIVKDLRAFCKFHKISYDTVRQNRRKGWSCAKLLEEPEEGVVDYTDKVAREESVRTYGALWKFTFPDGRIEISRGLKDFCIKNNLSLSGAGKSFKKGKVYKGFNGVIIEK